MNKYFQSKRFCEGCGQELEMWEDRYCETCKLLDALHEPDVIEVFPSEIKKLTVEVKTV